MTFKTKCIMAQWQPEQKWDGCVSSAASEEAQEPGKFFEP